MTSSERAHCEIVWKCLISKLSEIGEPVDRIKEDLSAYRHVLDRAVIISAKLALLTLEPPDKNVSKTAMDLVELARRA